jgi:hypothetical protein
MGQVAIPLDHDMTDKFEDIPENVRQAVRRLLAAGVDVEAFVDDYVAAIQAQATDEEVEAVMRGVCVTPPLDQRLFQDAQPTLPNCDHDNSSSRLTVQIADSLHHAAMETAKSVTLALSEFRRLSFLPSGALGPEASSDHMVFSCPLDAFVAQHVLQQTLPWAGCQFRIASAPCADDPATADYTAFIEVSPTASVQDNAIRLTLNAPDGRTASVELRRQKPLDFFDMPLPSDPSGMQLTVALLVPQQVSTVEHNHEAGTPRT